MLSGKMYTDEYIRELQNRTGNDPALLERVVYAFGLLEAIRRVELPFCFKGGTSLIPTGGARCPCASIRS